MDGRYPCVVKFQVQFFVKNKDVITGINNRVGVEQYIGAVIDPAYIARICLLAGKGYDGKIVEGEDEIRRKFMNFLYQFCLRFFAVMYFFIGKWDCFDNVSEFLEGRKDVLVAKAFPFRH